MRIIERFFENLYTPEIKVGCLGAIILDEATPKLPRPYSIH